MGHVVRMTATGAFGITFVFLVDAANLVWIAQLGDPRLVAAIGFAFAIQFFSVSSGVGLMIASTAMVSRSIGEGNREKARMQAGAAIVTAALIQAVVATLVILLRHDLLALAGATGETAAMAARYLLITMPSLVVMAIGLIASGVLRADGFGAKAMYTTLLSGTLLMVIDPVLILGFGWGLDGTAIGLWLFRAALMGLGLYFAVWQNKLIARPDLAAVRCVLPLYLAIAVPAIATQMATPVGNYLLTMVMAPFGDDAVAAWAVVGRLTVVVFGGIFALSGAIGGIFGQNFGAGNYARLRSTYRDALVFCLIYTLTMWCALFWATPYVSAVFGLTGQGAEVLHAFTLIGVGGFVFAGPLFVANAAFNSLGRPSRSTLLNWSKEAVLGWPAAAALALSFGASGVIYGQAFASMLVGTLAGVWGWRFVGGLHGARKRMLDGAALRPYPNPDRYRRR
ncbi:multidrug transporter MATE [Roseobacter denitrificans]|uniref:MATE efflux family protein, putative n=2 Tax=Roseobacter denitrificans TaxID=2434 RepID=Q168A8_ROSDO|nr:MATE family efflux transporter [Roseobacter denitrificans]ABG31685.1 MATE efflux family protein, putative [Roseobacter denitrificans OCh 114]AVL54650.1 multidrug transporter MATE [Roseobacter denitrificans]